MNLLEKKGVKVLMAALTGVFFISLLMAGFLAGGRWDLNEQIAFGDRLVHETGTYAQGMSDLFFPSSPYFPGVGYLSAFFQLIGFDDIYINNRLMLLVAVGIGLLYFVLLRKLTLKLYPQLSGAAVTLILLFFYLTHFRSYISYMIEFKPDTVLLVIATLGFLLLQGDRKPGMANIAVVAVLLFVSVTFKQSFFLVYILIGLQVFVNAFFSVKEKIVILLFYGLVGLLALYVVFQAPGLYYFTVKVMGQHPMLDTRTIKDFFVAGIIANIAFIAILIFFLIKNIRFSIFTIQGKYFLFAIVWFLFCAVSTAKLGGNVGNFEVGLIVFMPYVIYTTDGLVKRVYGKKIFLAAACTVLGAAALLYSYRSVRIYSKVLEKYKQDHAAIDFLSQNFAGKNAFVDGNTYVVASVAGIHSLSELETAGHFDNVPEYDFQQMKNAIRQKKYNLFFISAGQNESFSFFADKEIIKLVNENYKVYQNQNMPAHLEGRILVPKTIK